MERPPDGASKMTVAGRTTLTLTNTDLTSQQRRNGPATMPTANKINKVDKR